MRSWMVRRSWIIGLWAIGLLLAAVAHGESQRELRVIGVIDEPNRWLDGADRPVGIDVDILAELMQRLGLHYQLVLTSSALRALDSCQQPHPSVDMYLTLSYRPEREAWLLYPSQSHISFRWNFFALQEALPRLHFERYEDLKGLRIGVTKAFAYTAEFWRAVEQVPLRIDSMVKNELQLDKLLKGRIDLVPLNTSLTLYQLQKQGLQERVGFLPKPLADKPYYNVFCRGSDYPDLPSLVQRYDAVLQEMQQDGTLARIYARYGIVQTEVSGVAAVSNPQQQAQARRSQNGSGG